MEKTITETMTIGEILEVNPLLANVLKQDGMECTECPSSQTETLAQAAEAHGVDLHSLLIRLNKLAGILKG